MLRNLSGKVFVAALAVGEAVLRFLGYDRQYVNGVSSFHEFDPELGLRGKPNFTGRFNSADFDVTVSLDEHGFRRSARLRAVRLRRGDPHRSVRCVGHDGRVVQLRHHRR